MAVRSVTVVGTGNVGAALAKNLVQHGIEVGLSGRDAAKAKELAGSLGAKARLVEAAAVGKGVDAVFLAVPADAAGAVLEAAGGLEGVVVVDCTNPLTWDQGPVHAPPHAGSTTADLAHRFPKARVVKAWNTFGAEFHENAKLGSTNADVYFATDDADARRTVTELARTLGFEPVDCGGLRNATHLESLAVLWIHLAMVGGKGREVAFKLLKR
jgi:predicted dinucleotide-binding enzyme